jgi:hypothetical protein
MAFPGKQQKGGGNIKTVYLVVKKVAIFNPALLHDSCVMKL